MTIKDERLKQPTPNRSKVFVLNPYIPTYRVSFFSDLSTELYSHNVDLRLITGRPSKAFKKRGDYSFMPAMQVERRKFSLRFFGIELRYLYCQPDLKDAKVVVYEFSITNLNTWRALLVPRKHQAIVWGHGPGYLTKETRLRLWLQKVMAQKADLVLTYSETGRQKVVELGIDKVKVVSVNNTIPTKEIAQAVAELSQGSLEEFKEHNGVQPQNKLFAFIGALDKTKRIDFLAEVLDSLWEADKNIKLIVGGDGSQRALLDKSIHRGQTIYLGRVGPKEKALIAKSAMAIINPGNTGLLAVDALILKLPILGTAAPSSPEKDYLLEGEGFLTLSDDPSKFASQVVEFAARDKSVKYFGDPPKLEDFVSRFSEGIRSQFDYTSNTKLLIITNLPAPYRISLFTEIANYFHLTVAYTGWRDEGRMWDNTDSTSRNYAVIQGGRLFGFGNIQIPFATRRLKKSIRDAEAVITGGWNSPAFIVSLLQAKISGKASILWFESTLDSARFRSGPIAMARRLVFRLADTIFVPGESAVTAAREYTKNSIPIVEMTNPIQPMYLQHPRTSKVQSTDAGTRYLYFGRLIEVKRVDLLIEAFNLSANPLDKLTIVGDGPLKGRLMDIAASSERSEQINFEPGIPDSEAIEIYLQHDVLVLPSDREVWGMVIAEALVLGLRVVASSAAGATSTFKKFSSCISFQSGSVSDLAAQLSNSTNLVELTKVEHSELIKINSPGVFAQKMVQALNEMERK